jgi:Mrp family chromosome partitioning ATPase
MKTTLKHYCLRGEELDSKRASTVVQVLDKLDESILILDLWETQTLEAGTIDLLVQLVNQRAGRSQRTVFVGRDMPARLLTDKLMDVYPDIASARQAMLDLAQPQASTRDRSLPGVDSSAVAIPNAEPSTFLPDLLTIILAVLSRKWFLLAVAVIAVGAGLGAAYLFGSQTWETEAVLLYKPSDNDLADEYEVLQNLDESTTFIYRQGSRKENLTSTSVQIRTLVNTVKIPANLEAIRAALDLPVALNILGSAIDVRVQRDTELMIIRAVWDDAATAAAIVNGLVDIFIGANLRINKESIQDMRNRLASRLADVSSKLTSVERELRIFTERYRIVDIRRESEQYVQELIRLRTLRDEAASRKAALTVQIKNLDASITELNERAEAERTAMGSRTSVSEIEARIAALNRQLDDNKQRQLAATEYLSREADLDRIRRLHAEGLASRVDLDSAQAARDRALAASQQDPVTSALLAEIEALQAMKPDQLVATTATDRLIQELELKRFQARLDLVSAEGALSTYSASVVRVQQSIESLPAVNKEYARLSTEVAGLSAEAKGLERMLAQASTALEKGSGDFTIVAAAPVPIYPARSNRKLWAAGVAGALLALGWGGLLILELLDRRIRSVKEAEAALGINVLAGIPRQDRRRLMPGGSEEVPDIERYRIVAMKLRKAVPHKGARLLLASAVAQSGKSLFAANLAAVWGRSDERVLVMEAQTRINAKPWPLAALLAKPEPASLGLCDYLSFMTDSLVAITQPSILPGVDLVCRGTEGALPDLLGSARFRALLDEASDKYSIVLIEAPAILEFADAVLINPHCDATLFTLRSRSASPAKVLKALAEIDRSRLVGLVMTDLEPIFSKGES